MSTILKSAVSAIFVCAMTASISPSVAQPFPQPESSSTPKLSGKYVATFVDTCSSTITIESGLVTFNDSTGKATIAGYKVSNSKKPTLKTDSGTVAYSNTSTTFEVSGDTYKATYGPISGGIATYLSYVGVQSGDTCSEIGWLSRQ